jgi:hypothetical protein
MDETTLMLVFILISTLSSTLIIILNKIKKCNSFCLSCELEHTAQSIEQTQPNQNILTEGVITRLLKKAKEGLTPRRNNREQNNNYGIPMGGIAPNIDNNFINNGERDKSRNNIRNDESQSIP